MFTSALQLPAGCRRYVAAAACCLASAVFRAQAPRHVAELTVPPVLPTPACFFLQGAENMLRRLRVAWLVLPSVRQVLGMWRHSFNFVPLTLLYVHFCSATSCGVSKICCSGYLRRDSCCRRYANSQAYCTTLLRLLCILYFLLSGC
jgi:hypothetical protein